MENILTVSVLVFQEENILLLKVPRADGRARLTLPGGRLKDYESIEECAIREVMESAGVEITLDKKLSGVITREGKKDNFLVTFVFLAETHNKARSDKAVFIPYKDIESYGEVSEFSKLIIHKLNESTLSGIDRSEITDTEGRKYLMYF